MNIIAFMYVQQLHLVHAKSCVAHGVYVSARTCTHSSPTHTHVNSHTHTYIPTCTYMHTYLHTYTHPYRDMQAYSRHTDRHTYTHACISAQAYTSSQLHSHAHKHIHRHMHRYTLVHPGWIKPYTHNGSTCLTACAPVPPPHRLLT